MTLTTAEIERRITAAPGYTSDNVAQDIINNASDADLAGVDARGVLVLRRALTDGWYSRRDHAANQRLREKTQFQLISDAADLAVTMIKAAPYCNAAIRRELKPEMVAHIYAAEHKRLDIWERAGFDGDTIGRGQLGQPAFDDVRNDFPNAWTAFFTRFVVSRYIQSVRAGTILHFLQLSIHKLRFPSSYSQVYHHHKLEDFVVAAYLANRMKRASKPGRSFKDTARFGVALYHGMYRSLVAAQTSVGDDINWAPVAAHLRANGKADDVDYVDEVVK